MIDVFIPNIPLRGSSKNALANRITNLEAEHEKLEKTVRGKDQAIQLKGSIGDLSWWTQLSHAQEANVALHGVKRKLSQLQLAIDGDDEEAEPIRKWAQTSVGKRHIENEAVVKRTAFLLRQHKERMSITATTLNASQGRTWMKMFLHVEMQLNTKVGGRDNSLQTMFQEELERVMGRQKSNLQKTYWWCPIRGEYSEGMKAGHLFSQKYGPDMMTAIFGIAELEKYDDPKFQAREPGVRSELFRAVNGMLWCAAAEERFTKGLFVLVPDLGPDASQEGKKNGRCRQ